MSNRPTDYERIQEALHNGLPADASQESPDIVRRNIQPSTTKQYARAQEWFDA